MATWINIEAGLPEESGQVLGIMKDTLNIYVCHYKKERNLFLVYGAGADPISDMQVTHWQPLPSPPNINDESTPTAIPSSIVRELEGLNPQNSEGTDTKWYEYYGSQVQGEGKESFVHSAACYLACKMAEQELFKKVKELLSAQPAEQGDANILIKSLNDVRDYLDWLAGCGYMVAKTAVEIIDKSISEFKESRPSPVVNTNILVKALERIQRLPNSIGMSHEMQIIASKALSEFTTPQPDNKEEMK